MRKFLAISVLSLAASFASIAQAQTLQNTQQNAVDIGERNHIQQRVQVCGRLRHDMEAIEQTTTQDAVAIGERNRIQQRIRYCCNGRQNSDSSDQLQTAHQDAIAVGERNRIRQRLNICS